MKQVHHKKRRAQGSVDPATQQELPAILRRAPGTKALRLSQRRRSDHWELGGTSSALIVQNTSNGFCGAKAGPGQIAGLKLTAQSGLPEESLRALARDLMAEVHTTIEVTVQDHWLRKSAYRKSLEAASAKIAQAAVKSLTAELNAGQEVSPADIRAAVEAAVAEAVEHVPGFFRTENIIGFGLFAAGLTLTGFMNAGLMELAQAADIGTKLALQSVVSTCMGYLLACFSPHFNDKASNQSRALNYGIMNRVMSFLGVHKDKHEKAVAVDPGTQLLLGEVYIAHESFDARLRGVMTLIREHSLLMSEAFHRARSILDDETYEGRMVDACDHLAGVFVTARLAFYAIKPEFSDLFETYVCSVLEPILRKHSREAGPEMFELIMAGIRRSSPTPSEETIQKFYVPFVRGTLGLDHHRGRGLMGAVNEVLLAEVESKAHSR